MYRTCLICPVLAAALVLGAAGSAAAQYYPNPYGPYPYPTGGFGPGNTLSGGAQVIQASGQMLINQEQARQERQKYYQDKLVTKKMAFDEAAYEKANTPSFTEDQDRILGLQIRRVMNQPASAEISRGDTLNLLMPYIKTMSDQGLVGAPVPINPAMLRSINVKLGSAGAAPSAGLLKDAGRLSWPLALRGPRQKQLDKLLPQACSQAAARALEPPTYTKIVSEVLTMKEELRKQYHQEKISGSTFLTGQKYLDQLVSSLKVLERPDAAKFFDGSYTARGSNVPELVDNMMADGLMFSAAAPGVDAPYLSLHNAFVSYARTAQSGDSFQSRMAPPQLKQQKGPG